MGLLGNLSDNFDDGVLAAIFSTSTGATETGGRGRIVSNTSYPALRTAAAHTLQGSFALVRAYPAAAGTTTGAATSEMLIDSPTGGTRILIIVNTVANTISFRNDIGYGDGASTPIPYDAVAHAWWRIRETAGQVYLETAPDGITWTIRRQFATPAWATSTTLPLIFSSHRENGTLTNFFEVDNFNLPPVAVAPTAPTGLSAVPVDGTETTLSWTAVNGATSYEYELTRVQGGRAVTTVPHTTAAVGTRPANPVTVDYTNLARVAKAHDAYPELQPIWSQPQTRWYAEGTTAAEVQQRNAEAAGKTQVLSIYAIPNRDGGGAAGQNYSAGGFANRAAYIAWVTMIRDAIGTAPAVLIYEADALGHANALADPAERIETMRQAVSILATLPNAEVYIDAGSWVPATEMADLLRRVDVAKVAGFAVNVSAYNTNAYCYTYGNSLATALTNLGITGKRFVVDTSRNGVGPLTEADRPLASPWLDTNQTWCNPPARRIGINPGPITGQGAARASLWVKGPGESDGAFPTLAQSSYYGQDAPKAGDFWLVQARDLVGIAPGTAVPPTTGTVSTVSADFETGWGSFTSQDPAATRVAGRGRIPMSPAYPSLFTAKNLQLTNGSVSARLYMPVGAAAGAVSADVGSSFFVDSAVGGTRAIVALFPKTGTIRFHFQGPPSPYWDNGAPADLPYDAVAHAYVRIREAAGQAYIETSPDGAAWTVRRQVATQAWMSEPTNNVIFSTYADVAGGYAEIDNVNIIPSVVKSGTAITAVGHTTTAVGRRIARGTAVTAVSHTTAAAGRRTARGTAVTAVSHTTAAIGRRIARGAAVTAVSHATRATGRKITRGAATITAAHTTSAVGRTTTRGTALLPVSHLTIAAGGTGRAGAATVTVPHAVSATGRIATRGAATTAVPHTTSATGRRITRGTATVTVPHTTAAVGGIAKRGSAVTQVAHATSAVGRKATRGSAVTQVAHATSAVGRKATRGTAVVAVPHTTSAAGRRAAGATAVTTVLHSTRATGQRLSRGTASTAVPHSTTASGRSALRGAAYTSVAHRIGAFGGTAVGGSARLTVDHTTTAAGRIVARGTAVLAIPISSSATGRKITRGTATTAVSHTTTAAGRRPARGSAVVAVSHATAAVGRRIARGAAVTTVAHATAAVGRALKRGAAALVQAHAVSSAGTRVSLASAALQVPHTGSAAGVSPQVGVSAGTARTVVGHTVRAAGRTAPFGSAALSAPHTGSAAGARPTLSSRSGTASTAVPHSMSATGRRVPTSTARTTVPHGGFAAGRTAPRGQAVTSVSSITQAHGARRSQGTAYLAVPHVIRASGLLPGIGRDITVTARLLPSRYTARQGERRQSTTPRRLS